MITKQEFEQARTQALKMLSQAGIRLTAQEVERFEVADFGLGQLNRTGLELITYINTSRVCAKELVLFPRQTCPEHYHPPVAGEIGKEETFRCRAGTVYLYVPGQATRDPHGHPPAGDEAYYSASHEIVLQPGEQYTLLPGTPHWFQGGESGAIVSEFSTTSRDEFDIFRDPRIQRAPLVAE